MEGKTGKVKKVLNNKKYTIYIGHSFMLTEIFTGSSSSLIWLKESELLLANYLINRRPTLGKSVRNLHV